MAKTVATLLGVVFLLVGLAGFFAPNLLGTHLRTTHNILHRVSGVVSLYFGLAASQSAAKAFCLVFGLVYGALGVLGFLLGQQATVSMAGMGGAQQDADSRLWTVIPGQLVLGTMDHLLHIALGVLYLLAGLLTRTDRHAHVQEKVEMYDRPGTAPRTTPRP
jgi:hypothetical protein